MSIDGLTYEFLDIASLKDFLKILQTDDADDILLRNTIGPSADKFVKNNIFAFADSFPLAADLQETASGAAFKKAVSLYKGHVNNLESSKMWEEMAKKTLRICKTR